MKRTTAFPATALAICAALTLSSNAADLTAAEARAIAKEAYIYGFPLVDNYRIQHSYFVDRGGPEFKAAWNTLVNNARVYTPEDRAIQTPNSDTPYSYVGADLRAEPLVFTVPAVEEGRYYSLQFIDLYTFNFAYAGSRATGSGAGSYLLAGPKWTGGTPKGIKSVIRCETEFAFVLYRTQLFNPGDIENVKNIQAGYQVQTLSQFLGAPAPAAAPAVDFIKPFTAGQVEQSRKLVKQRDFAAKGAEALAKEKMMSKGGAAEKQRELEQERIQLGQAEVEFFNVLNFILQFCPTHPSEEAMMGRFAKIGIGAGKTIDGNALSAEYRKALGDGMADAWAAFKEYKETQIDTGKRSSSDSFGTREFLNGSYLDRMSGAVLGIYGNSKDEAMYPAYFVDDARKPLSGASRYTMRFAPGQLPPVNAFWSLTLYQLPASLLYANPLNRYLINSPMLPGLKRDEDGGVTLYVQAESPGKEKEANWLPAPRGPFFMAMRLYWPKAEALDGKWQAPALQNVK